MVCKHISLHIIFYFLFHSFISKHNDISYKKVYVRNVDTYAANKIIQVRKCKYYKIMTNYCKEIQLDKVKVIEILFCTFNDKSMPDILQKNRIITRICKK